MEVTFTIIASIALGIALAASCGLRAFLPLLLTGLVARFTDLLELGEAFEWLCDTPALIAFSVGALLELFGDKIPGLNHFLDAIQTPVRTVAGILVSGAVIVELPIWCVAILALIIGGGTALSVHTAKSAFRLGTNAFSVGVVNPLVSILEDLMCILVTLFSLLFSLVAFVVALGGFMLFALSAQTLWRRYTS